MKDNIVDVEMRHLVLDTSPSTSANPVLKTRDARRGQIGGGGKRRIPSSLIGINATLDTRDEV